MTPTHSTLAMNRLSVPVDAPALLTAQFLVRQTVLIRPHTSFVQAISSLDDEIMGTALP